MIEIAASGPAHDRGRAQAGAASAEMVRRVIIQRVEEAQASGVLDGAALDYLAAQHAFHLAHDPEGLAELAGVAGAFGLSEHDLFAHLHLATLRDLKGGARIVDGCSAWAVGQGPEGPLLVKNRDVTGPAGGVQCVLRHSGPDIATGEVLSLSSLGSLAAWSSGINAAGLAVADTQVPVKRHRTGWLRYFLLPRLLARAASVAQALAVIRSLPHAGGGTLVMADRSGATAAVELSAGGPLVAEGGPQWRTNHYVTPEAAAETLMPEGDRIAATSRARFAHLARMLPGRDWTRAAAKRFMATHDGPGAAPLCQHSGMGLAGSQTISCVIYSCSLGGMEIGDGPPCLERWQQAEPCRQTPG